MRCDLHGCTLLEAKDELLLKLEECQMNGDHELEVVHGHHGGTVLRDSSAEDYKKLSQFY